MSPASLKSEIESVLTTRFGSSSIRLREKFVSEARPIGIPDVDAVSGGLPRGAITEIVGPASSGKTSLLLCTLAQSMDRQEFCALVDTNDVFDPAAAAAAGIDLDKLLWVRCSANTEHALKITDLLLQGRGFGLVVLDLGEISSQCARRIPLTFWFRFRRAIENTPTSLLLIEEESYAQACAALTLEMNRESAVWSGSKRCSHLLRGMRIQVRRRKPVTNCGLRIADCGFSANWIEKL